MKQPVKYLLSTAFLALVFFVAASHHNLAFAASNNQSTQGTSGSTTCTPPATTTPGVHVPTGSSAWTFTYNCKSGLWENQYYTYNPTTGGTTPITPLVYTYNAVTGMWDANQWIYDAATKVYVQSLIQVAQPPDGAITVGGPTTSDTGSGGSSSSSATAGGSNSSATTTTSPNDPNINVSSADSQNLNSTNGVTLNNLLSQIAQSGNASVSQNTTAGSASSGNTSDMANLINMVESESSLAGESPTTFVENLYGNVNGNLLIDPTQLAQALQSSNSVDPTSPYDVTVNSQNTGTINNNVNLLSNSGNANVSSNTSAGSATSGNAVAMANIVNMIDSLIASNQSFLGEINIYGNLDGNILMPQQFLNSLLSSNAPSVTVPLSQLSTSSINAAFNNNENINNNVNSSASSGQAGVDGNTSAGSAQSGNATTNVTLFNLTGDVVVGNNVMLVFVNVLGSWVGLLMNAPAGTTAAAFGSGITQNSVVPTNTTINSNNNDQINNNITASANSGDASVTNNTSAGNATTGSAETGVNVLNIDNSQFDLTGWFGILFINVFGSWDGSFGVAPAPSTTSNSTSSSSSTNSGNTPVKHAVLQFEATGDGSGNVTASSINNTGPNTINLVSDQVSNKVKTVFSPKVADSSTEAKKDNLISIISASVVVAVGVILFTIERILSISKAKK